MIERRQHRRIITLKNFGRVILVAFLAWAAMNVISELRAPRGNEYGRITKRDIDRTAPALSTRAPQVEVVEESPAPAAEPALAPPLSPPPSPPRPLAIQQPSNPASTISIVGDENGVTIVTPRHKLRGGFGRQ